MKLSAPTDKEIAEIRAIARKTLVKDKRITIRLYDHDYHGIQKKAIEMGIPYQDAHFGYNSSVYRRELISKTG